MGDRCAMRTAGLGRGNSVGMVGAAGAAGVTGLGSANCVFCAVGATCAHALNAGFGAAGAAGAAGAVGILNTSGSELSLPVLTYEDLDIKDGTDEKLLAPSLAST